LFKQNKRYRLIAFAKMYFISPLCSKGKSASGVNLPLRGGERRGGF
jgi:hypothetical protein